MAVTGWIVPTANTVEAGSGTWTNDTNIRTDDGTEATFSLAVKNTAGRWNAGQTFGLGALIPAGSTITKVEIRAEWRVNSTSGIATLGLQSFVSAGAVGAERTNATEPTTLTTDTFDVTADRTWTRANLLDGTFELKVRGTNGNSTNDPSYRVDHIAVQVTYTPITGAAALTGTGSATVAGVRTRLGVAALTGTGSQTAAGVRTRLGVAALTGTGSLTADGTVTGPGATVTGEAALTGAGSSSVTGVRTRLGVAALSGTGSGVVAGTRSTFAAGALTGAGSLAVSGVRSTFAVVALTGTGSQVIAGLRLTFATAALVGTGTSDVAGVRSRFADAALTAAGSLVADGARLNLGAAALTGIGTLSVFIPTPPVEGGLGGGSGDEGQGGGGSGSEGQDAAIGGVDGTLNLTTGIEGG